MRETFLGLLIVLGLIGLIFFGIFAFIDYASLMDAHQHFERAVRGRDITEIFIAETKQNIHRVNLAAKGGWALLCAVIAAIGVHGLCTMRNVE